MEKYIVLFLLSVLCIAIGILNCLGNISTVKWKHRRNVTPADIPAYGKWVGSGTLVIGITILVSTILELILHTPLPELLYLPGFLTGMALILFAQLRYNKGLF